MNDLPTTIAFSMSKRDKHITFTHKDGVVKAECENRLSKTRISAELNFDRLYEFLTTPKLAPPVDQVRAVLSDA